MSPALSEEETKIDNNASGESYENERVDEIVSEMTGRTIPQLTCKRRTSEDEPSAQ
jgi:hypothetical protein